MIVGLADEIGAALGRIRDAPMNKTEARYAQQLEMQKRAGLIVWYLFGALKLRLADTTFYTPDFFVLNDRYELEVHEVKGHWEDDARVKIKVAAAIYPFRFVAIRAEKTGWEYEEF